MAIKKKAQRLVDELLSEGNGALPAPSIRQYVAWLKPDGEGEGTQDAPFMFSNGLEYKAKEVHLSHNSSAFTVTDSHLSSLKENI